MDATKQPRRRSGTEPESTTPEIRKCQYCKGQFEVNPQFPHKQFCKESHRKLHWKYGSQSIGKLAERIERDMRKLIAAELAGMRPEVAALRAENAHLRSRLEALERGGESGWPDPEAGEPANIDWDTIDAARREHETRKRGGGATA